MAFRLRHFLLLLRLCDDCYARQARGAHRQYRSQPDDVAHLCIGRVSACMGFCTTYWQFGSQKSKTASQFPVFEPSSLLSLAPLFLLFVSNIEGFLEILHRHGIFWPAQSTSNFWTWLGIKDLSDPPTQPLAWIPDRFWWWWRASRVVSDFDLRGNFQEIIDEFPFFSFLLGDLHPHVLAIPFNLLAVAIALNFFSAVGAVRLNS